MNQEAFSQEANTESTPMKKKRKWLKGLIIAVPSAALAAVLVLLLVSGIGFLRRIGGGEFVWPGDPRPDVPPIAVNTRNLSGFAADALYLVQMVERAHPIFIVEGFLPENYAAVRDAFIYEAKGFTTRSEFILAAYRYTATLQDGHMTGFNLFAPNYLARTYPGMLQIDWGVHDGRLFLHDENGRTGTEVTSIGGAPIALVWELIDEHFFHENAIYRDWNLALYSRYSAIIELAGGKIEDGRIVVTLESHDGTAEMERRFQMPQPMAAFTRLEEVAAGMDFIIRDEMIGDDIFFIDLRIFVLGDHIDETAARIEQAIENGLRKFIVDLRDNGGGTSWVGTRLLRAMGISVPRVGVIRRFSPLMIDESRYLGVMPALAVPMLRGLTLFADGMRSEPCTCSVSNANEVFVSILTNNGTYSAATMMAYWVQDSGFGNIVGAPSLNAPSSFGDMLFFNLPYTGLQARVSHARFLRPDANADQSVLWPDIMVDPADALEAAIEYLRGRTEYTGI